MLGVNCYGVVDYLTKFVITNLEQFGILFGFLIIVVESFIPILPLGVFIAFNMISFGFFTGFVVSLIATVVGCLVSYCFFYFLSSCKFIKRISSHKRVLKVIDSIYNIDFSKLVLLVSLPFTPAFLINIACGISKVPFKKFILSIVIGKVSIVYFWGYIGKSLFESFTDINTVIKVVFLLVLSYIISKIVSKKFKVE